MNIKTDWTVFILSLAFVIPGVLLVWWRAGGWVALGVFLVGAGASVRRIQ